MYKQYNDGIINLENEVKFLALPRWVLATIEKFNLPKETLVDTDTLSTYMCKDDINDYLNSSAIFTEALEQEYDITIPFTRPPIPSTSHESAPNILYTRLLGYPLPEGHPIAFQTFRMAVKDDLYIAIVPEVGSCVHNLNQRGYHLMRSIVRDLFALGYKIEDIARTSIFKHYVHYLQY